MRGILRTKIAQRRLYKSVLTLHSDYEASNDLLPSDACHPIEGTNGGAVWVLRGTCNFINKTQIAHQAGATAVLIGNAGKRKSSSTELVAIRCPEQLPQQDCEIPITTVMISERDSSRLFTWYKEHPAISVRIFALDAAPVDWCAVQLWLLMLALVVASAFAAPLSSSRDDALTGSDDEGFIVLGMIHTVMFAICTSSAVVVLLCFYGRLCKYGCCHDCSNARAHARMHKHACTPTTAGTPQGIMSSTRTSTPLLMYRVDGSCR